MLEKEGLCSSERALKFGHFAHEGFKDFPLRHNEAPEEGHTLIDHPLPLQETWLVKGEVKPRIMLIHPSWFYNLHASALAMAGFESIP